MCNVTGGPKVGIHQMLYYILYTYFWPTLYYTRSWKLDTLLSVYEDRRLDLHDRPRHLSRPAVSINDIKSESLIVWSLKAIGSIPNVSDNFSVAKQNKESKRLPWSCPAMDHSTRCCVVCREQRADRWRQHGTPVGRHTPSHCTAEYSPQ